MYRVLTRYIDGNAWERGTEHAADIDFRGAPGIGMQCLQQGRVERWGGARRSDIDTTAFARAAVA